MTVEAKIEEMADVVVTKEETKKVEVVEEKAVVQEDVEPKETVDEVKPKKVEKSSSYREESNFLSDLKEFERKALSEFKMKLEEAILGNNLFEKLKEENLEKKEVGKGDVKEEEKEHKGEEEKNETDLGVLEVGEEISLWGVTLLPSKGAEGLDVILLKFLRAREFKVNEAFEMLKKTLKWRKESKIDSILEEDLCGDLSSTTYIDGVDRQGHPVCFNIFGVFENEELYQKTFGTEEQRNQFLRWRIQLMEKGIQKLDLKPGGVSSLLQITDLKNSPGPSKKELRVAMSKTVSLLQDNYPELVAKNIIINAPFWYYALSAIVSPFLSQRSKSKLVVVRPAKVTETLLKYISIEEIPVQYGGFKRESDSEFSGQDVVVQELILKPGSTETIEISAKEVGSTLTWDLTVLGWEVKYKEEFIPDDEGSYTIIVQKGKKMDSQEAAVRNTFRNSEEGKVIITIENTSTKRKKAFYRYKNSAKGSF